MSSWQPRVLRSLAAFGTYFWFFVLYIFGLAAILVGVRFVLDQSSNVHWVLGIVTA